MFNWLYEFLGSMLSWFSSLFGGSYALGLLLYALLFKILFLPFSVKQQKNQIKMAKLAPKIELIKAKYKGRTDQPTMQKQQQEIMDLQQKEGYNPLSGCLPLLLQMPIIIFLYNVIRNPLSYICKLSEGAVVEINNLVNGLSGETAVEFSKINQIGLVSQINNYSGDLSQYDLAKLPNFTLLGTDLSSNPSFKEISWLVVIPFLAAGLTYLSMVLTRKWNGNGTTPGQDAQTAASMKIMDYTMPLMTLWLAFSLSGMLGVYWIYQSLLGILQTFIISRVMPLPKYSEEELKEMRKQQKAAEKAQRTAVKQAPKYRSLHYIDEEDYEELPELKTDNKQQNISAGMDIPEIKD